jgi:ferredoxin
VAAPRGETRIRVSVDRGVCCAAGQCALTAPGVFTQDPSDGTVVLLEREPPAASYEAVTEAVDLCPMGAISVSPST